MSEAVVQYIIYSYLPTFAGAKKEWLQKVMRHVLCEHILQLATVLAML